MYPGDEVTRVTLDPGNIMCSNFTSNSCRASVTSDHGYYTISVSQINDIGHDVREAVFDCELICISHFYHSLSHTHTHTHCEGAQCRGCVERER